MIAPEAWLLAVVAATAAAAMPAPPPELLEFLGDWSPEEQRLIDQETARKAPASTNTKEAADEHARKDSDESR